MVKLLNELDNNNLQRISWSNCVILCLDYALVSKYIVNIIELKSNIQSNHEKKFEHTQYFEEEEKVHYLDNIQKIKNSNINTCNRNCKMIIVTRNVKNKDVVLNLKNENGKKSCIKNGICGIHLII